MTTKEYLSQISRMDANIKNKMAELEQYKTMMYGLQALALGERVQSSPNPDKIGGSIAKLLSMEDKLDKMIDNYVDIKSKIIEQIDGIDNEKYYNILFARYVEKKTFEKIADEMNISFRHILRLHGSAIADFGAKYGHLYEKNRQKTKRATKCH